MKEKYSIRRSRAEIKHALAWVSKRWIKAKKAQKLSTDARAYLTEYMAKNEDFADIRSDAMENNSKVFLLAIFTITIVIDYAALHLGMEVLGSFGIPRILKYIVPGLLVFIEVGISFFSFTTSTQPKHGLQDKIQKVLPYFVIVFIVALSALVVFFTHGHFAEYLGSLISQGLLLASSIMLHLWLIRHAADIVEAIGYFAYKANYSRLASRAIKAQNRFEKNINAFTEGVTSTIEMILRFYSLNPESEIDFTLGITEDLIGAINRVMGRDAFTKYRESNVHTIPN